MGVFKYRRQVLAVLSFLVMVLYAASSLLTVPAAAISQKVLQISDYITEKIYDGDEVLIVYDLLQQPSAFLWGYEDDGSTTSIVRNAESFRFEQDVETQTSTITTFHFTSASVLTFTETLYDTYFYDFADASFPLDVDVVCVTASSSDWYVPLQSPLSRATYVNDDGVQIIGYGNPALYGDGSFAAFDNGQYWFVELDSAGEYAERIWSVGAGDCGIRLWSTAASTEIINEYDYFYGAIYPLGTVGGIVNVFEIDDLKTGSYFYVLFEIAGGINYTGTAGDARVKCRALYYDENGKKISYAEDLIEIPSFDGSTTFTHACSLTVPDDATYCCIEYLWMKTAVAECEMYEVALTDFTMICPISAVEDNSRTMEAIQDKLDDLDESISDVKDRLDSVNQSIQDTNDKLDDLGDKQDQANEKLDDIDQNIGTLPGEIGDEIQGIIDSENDKATASGQEFVDKIMEALPDPSVEVLAALKSLTDATAYTGTEAVLPIPAIVMPRIGNLVPETELWGGTDMDFSAYVELLPSFLLGLVRNLFTVAIVLYCVYELKGTISYCLTLRENKGG